MTVLPPDDEVEPEEPADDLPADVRPLVAEDGDLMGDLVTVLPLEEVEEPDLEALVDVPDLTTIRPALLLVFPADDCSIAFFATTVE